jgi:RNA-binding protein YlmH
MTYCVGELIACMFDALVEWVSVELVASKVMTLHGKKIFETIGAVLAEDHTLVSSMRVDVMHFVNAQTSRTHDHTHR